MRPVISRSDGYAADRKAVIRFLASAQAACLNKCVAIEGAAHTLRVVKQLPARDTERVKLTLWGGGPFLEDQVIDLTVAIAPYE